MALTVQENLMNGRSDHSCDDKNRIVLPLRFRSLLGDEFVLAMGPCHSIRAYPKPIFEKIAEFAASRDIMDEFDPNSAILQRMVGNSEIVSLDNQNRITVPRYLKEWADLKDDGTPNAIFGSGSRVEIWNKSTWAEHAHTSLTEEAIKAASVERKPSRANSEPMENQAA